MVTRLGVADAFVGGVNYSYAIGKTEVTNAQYVEFLNAIDPSGTNARGLYNSGMAGHLGGITNSGGSAGNHYVVKAGRGAHPVNYVSWWDSVRFVNWMHNGQGAGDTENGAYSLPLGEPASDNRRVNRNASARYWLPSESEWHKAAYHDANAGTAGEYHAYANGSDVAPVSLHSATAPSGANYFNFDGLVDGVNDGYAAIGDPNLQPDRGVLTDVGAYTDAASPYGAFDLNGNVAEWTEGRFTGSSTYRIVRGGSWSSTIGGIPDPLMNYYRIIATHDAENAEIGFRIATVPEATAGAMAVAGLLASLRSRRVRP